MQQGIIVSTLKEGKERRYYLDWLRIVATLLLIPYHSALIFKPHVIYSYYLENSTTHPGFELFIRFVNQWFMPLFFFIAGAAAKYSLDSRSKQEYCFERLKRLLIPFLFGIFVLLPPIGYFTFLNHHQNVKISFLQYYPLFFKIDYKHINGFTGTFTPGHFWFILYLIGFSFILLPFSDYLKTSNGQNLIKAITSLSHQPKVIIFLYVIPLTLARMTCLVYYNPIYYFLFFILGYLFIFNQQIEIIIEQNNTIALSFVLTLTIFLSFLDISEFHLVYNFTLINVLIQLILSINSFCWLIVLLNFAKQYLNWSNRFVVYFNQASYPVYIVHMNFIIIIGFYTVQWDINIIFKFMFVTFASFLSILIFYESIKRFNLMRFLFGIKFN